MWLRHYFYCIFIPCGVKKEITEALKKGREEHSDAGTVPMKNGGKTTV